jgi:hypothetical protein
MAKNAYTTPLYQPVDIVIKGTCVIDNPFVAEVRGVFTGPGGSYSIPGFYDGDGAWKVRFSPTSLGAWTYTLVSPHIKFIETEGQVACIANKNPNIHGGVVVDPADPYHFKYEDGTPYFMFAYEADWFWALGLGDTKLTKARELLVIIKSYGFNQIIVQAYAHDAEWCKHKNGSKDHDYGPPSVYA